MTKISGPGALAVLALALGAAVSADLPLQATPLALAGLATGLTVVLVIALLDRRAPRRVVALGVATLAAALVYDAVRAERGILTLTEGAPTHTFERTEPRRRPGPRALRETIVLEAVESDGTAVLRRNDDTQRVRVSPLRAARVGDYRMGQPRTIGGAERVPGPTAVTLTVTREPAALLAGLGLLVAAIGVAWVRW
jgi:hypothetical protein